MITGVLAVLEERGGVILGGKALVKLGRELHLRVAQGGENTVHAERRRAVELLDFVFALHNELHSYRLDAACRQRRTDLAPQHRRQLEANETVEHATCLLGIHQVDVQRPRMCQCLIDSGFGNFVEDNTFHLSRIHFGHLHQMPRDGLALAVIIRRQPNRIRLRGFLLDVVDECFFVVQNFVLRFKVMGDVDTHALRREVAHMPLAGDYGIVLADELLDGLGLRRRLYDD